MNACVHLPNHVFSMTIFQILQIKAWVHNLHYICSLKKYLQITTSRLQDAKKYSLFHLSHLTNQLRQSKHDFEAISHKYLGLSRTSGHTSMKKKVKAFHISNEGKKILNMVVHMFHFSKESLEPFPRICSILWHKHEIEQQIRATITFSLSYYEQRPQNIQSLLVLWSSSKIKQQVHTKCINK